MSKKRQSIPAKAPNSNLGSGQGNLAQALLVKGFGLHQQGELIAAREIYAQILKIQPLHFDALHLSGLVAVASSNFEVAIELIKKAISVNPTNPAAYCNLGSIYLEIGNYPLAIDYYTRASINKPNYWEAFYSRGLAHQKTGNYENAKKDYEKALLFNPGNVGALTNMGNVYQIQKDFEKAASYYGKAIASNPEAPEPYNNRGNLYFEQKSYVRAAEDFARALLINPKYAEAHSNMGNVLFALKDYDGALESYNKAISLNSKYAEAYHNRGNLLRELRMYELAASDYQNTIAIKPDYEYVRGVLFSTKLNLCEWEFFDRELQEIKRGILSGQKIIAPFMVLPISDSIDLQRRSAEIWVQDKYSLGGSQVAFGLPKKYEKIKIGYFSADFYEHATMYLMAQLFELHDKSRFEIIGFSFGPNRRDEMRLRAEAAFDQFYDVRDKTDKEISELSRDLGVHIAVDLKGFTMDSRSGIFAMRAAPIQINYLGYPSTMGATYIDYIIADRVIIPEHLKSKYAEKVIYLPNCYQVNDQKRVISEKIMTKSMAGLPQKGFIYCCFNSSYKITPEVFDSWMRILDSVDGSVIWIFGDNNTVRSNLKKEAHSRGVNPERVIFADPMPLSEHLSRHKLADLFLDTWPCNAHTTTSDALWAGLPVLTKPGEAFASRVAASLLTAVDLPQLIAGSKDEYENLAIFYGKNRKEIDLIKESLKERKKNSPLFDSHLFARNLEAIYDNLILNQMIQ